MFGQLHLHLYIKVAPPPPVREIIHALKLVDYGQIMQTHLCVGPFKVGAVTCTLWLHPCTGDNLLAKARGLSPRTRGKTM